MTSGALIVASYNIRRGIGHDGRQDVERVADVIHELAPDILALQEVDSALEGATAPGQLERLQALVGFECVRGVTLRREDAAYGNAVLSRLPVREVRHHDISVEGVEPRGVVDVDLALGDRTVRLLATHLGLRSAERSAQVARLTEILDAGEDRPLILVGDFNEWRVRRGSTATLERRFGRWDGPPTYPARWPLLRLDRIWADRRVWSVDALRAHRSPLARRASDHLPIRASVRLRGWTG